MQPRPMFRYRELGSREGVRQPTLARQPGARCELLCPVMQRKRHVEPWRNEPRHEEVDPPVGMGPRAMRSLLPKEEAGYAGYGAGCDEEAPRSGDPVRSDEAHLERHGPGGHDGHATSIAPERQRIPL